MKKKIFIFSLIVIIFNFIALTSNAVEDIPPEVDVEEVKTKMSMNVYFNGNTFNEGIYGYFYRVEVTDIKESGYNYVMRDVEICSVSMVYNIAGRNSMDFKYIRKNHVSTVVAFDNGGTKKGYEYTLLYALGYTTDKYTNDRSDVNGFNIMFHNRKTLYSSGIETDSSTTTLEVDSTKKYAHLVLVGDVYISKVRLVQIQKLWFGENAVWNEEAMVYVFSHIRTQVVCFD